MNSRCCLAAELDSLVDEGASYRTYQAEEGAGAGEEGRARQRRRAITMVWYAARTIAYSQHARRVHRRRQNLSARVWYHLRLLVSRQAQHHKAGSVLSIIAILRAILY